jgi:predicted metal-dependent phosphoesterase TrpH
MKFDLHLHTNLHSPDSIMDPVEMVHQARRLGLDGLVITEHDWLWTETELRDLRKIDPNLVVLGGIEVSAHEGHFLVYGVYNPFAVRRGIGVAELCREVHRQGGAVVAAHPFRWGQPFDEILTEERPELDGVEMMSNNMDAELRRRTAEVQRRHGFAGLGNSDAHELRKLGFCYTEFEVPVRNNSELVAAIRERRSLPRQR